MLAVALDSWLSDSEFSCCGESGRVFVELMSVYANGMLRAQVMTGSRWFMV